MAMNSEALREAERLLTHTRWAYSMGGNMSDTKVDRGGYEAKLQSTSWTEFVSSADYHYFVARVLLSQHVFLYGLFCAHQCVEVYLKGYLKYCGVTPPQTHRLISLLVKARGAAAESDEFVHTEHAETICIRFEPFYEMARYPVQITSPDGGYWMGGGDDEIFLDYFVHQMRNSLKLPSSGWDILSEMGHHQLHIVKESRPDFYSLFTSQNPHFPSESSLKNQNSGGSLKG